MEEKITKIKDYVKENISNLCITFGVIATSFVIGRSSAKEDIEVRTTHTDNNGNIIRDVYRRRVR